MMVLQWLAMLIIAPWAAFIVAALFVWLWRSIGGWVVGITAVLWALYGLYESLIYLQFICSGECNIRVDLLLIYPLLLLMSVVSLALAWFRRGRVREGTGG